MGRPRKPPAILVEATVRRSSKLAALPSDTARLGFFYVVLAEAKLADPPGQFASAAHFREVAGRFARYLDDYVRVGVLELGSKLCVRCAGKWASMPPKRPALVVHDWHDHQYDPRRLDRQQAYDERQREGENDLVSDAVSDGISDPVSDAQSDGVSDADSRAPVREPTRSGAANVERRTRTENESLHEEDSSTNGHERADIAALKDRGWPKVSRAQRKVLNEILARHDVTGPEFAAAAIRATPPDRDPLDAVMTADRLWQDAQRRQADAEEERAKAARAEEAVPWLR